MNGIIIFVVLVCCGLIFGRASEHRHFRSIRVRENNLAQLSTTSKRVPTCSEKDIDHVKLVFGNVVISIDYFKKIMAALSNIFGGQLTSYESLLDRARREAVLRLKESCPQADQIVNLRIETSSISKGDNKQIGSVEILAYGTAVFSKK
ncbi:MAG: YbjQ family protein [Deltaproteobacteria bacterium]|nr:YbjQ family protein [Deltaproteobacteria bacterium]